MPAAAQQRSPAWRKRARAASLGLLPPLASPSADAHACAARAAGAAARVAVRATGVRVLPNVGPGVCARACRVRAPPRADHAGGQPRPGGAPGAPAAQGGAAHLLQGDAGGGLRQAGAARGCCVGGRWRGRDDWFGERCTSVGGVWVVGAGRAAACGRLSRRPRGALPWRGHARSLSCWPPHARRSCAPVACGGTSFDHTRCLFAFADGG